MKKIIIFTILLIMLMPSLATAQTNASLNQYNLLKWKLDPWTKDDTYRQIGIATSIAFDIYQTIVGMKHDGYEWENSPTEMLFGNYPTTKELISWGIVSSIGNYYIAKILPTKLRKYFQISSMVFEYNYISKSYGTKLILKID